MTDLPLAVDANQGWKERNEALDMICWMRGSGVVMVEQPMPKSDLDTIARLTEASPLPIFADESVQRLADVERLKSLFRDQHQADEVRYARSRKMRKRAEELGMKVMMGCMTETSCAISAAAQLYAGMDFADLDGALLIGNDCFEGAKLENGKIIASDLPGIGVMPLGALPFGRE